MRALAPYLGGVWGRDIFSLGLLGAALVATVVVCLTAAWGMGEIFGFKRSLEHHPREAPWLYVVCGVALLMSGGVVLSGVNLVDVTVGVEVMNALLLPIVLGFLYALARKALPAPYRLQGWYAWVTLVVIVMTAGFGASAGVWGLG